MNGKQFVVAALLTLVLLTIAVTPMSSQQDVHDYDPWADYNGDGKIDIKDVANTAIKFGTSGDSTRNVNVTNWPNPSVAATRRNIGEKFNWTVGEVVDVSGHLYAYLGYDVAWVLETTPYFHYFFIHRFAKWEEGWLEITYGWSQLSSGEMDWSPVTLSPYTLVPEDWSMKNYLIVTFLES